LVAKSNYKARFTKRKKSVFLIFCDKKDGRERNKYERRLTRGSK